MCFSCNHKVCFTHTINSLNLRALFSFIASNKTFFVEQFHTKKLKFLSQLEFCVENFKNSDQSVEFAISNTKQTIMKRRGC